MKYVDNSDMYRLYQSLLFSRIVPCVRDIGLWGDKVQSAYADMGVLDNAKADLVALMRQDEEIAERYDEEKAERELAIRQAEVNKAIALGAE
jgi:outer membrane translocation and assembly module TamA